MPAASSASSSSLSMPRRAVEEQQPRREELSHAYTTLLSTLHERSSLLAAPSATIPPSLNRTLQKQIDNFVRAAISPSISSEEQKKDVKMKWDRVEEGLSREEEGRKVLLAAKDR